MLGKRIVRNSLRVFFITIFLFLSPGIVLSEDKKRPSDCLDKAVEKIKEIRSLPDMKYLHTQDGQNVLLNEFFAKGLRKN